MLSRESHGIYIESDFIDYYDELSSEENYIGIYERHLPTETRGTLLNQLTYSGIRTVDLRAAREFDSSIRYLVVYTNPKLHNSLGKRVVSLEEAKLIYPNNLASPFYEESNGETLKYLQVGCRRFRVNLKSDDPFKMKEGRIVKIEELSPYPNYTILKPIFSIDYISTGKEMIAVDFNPIQNLGKIGFEEVMSAEEVMHEIKKALIAYNKI